MPTYDYRCNACDHEFELFQSMSAPVKKKCPSCGKLALERLIGTGAAVLFKGSGFYETDYRSKSYKDAAKKDSEAAKPKTDTSSDAKSVKAGSSKTPPSAKPSSAPSKSTD
ncbi:hypothetical protein MNBD_PLANCTO03-2142 [hydrothermal vent metagenome]|uniref:Putative regulatory protein FmdB zinc ribbon domain-containing protein n=1 Tax=hydrothermal vent metagenome TaxID=652676 RepID=A0A3B1DV90_9ZZZZ